MANILLVEDNDLNRDMLSRRLRRRGYEITIAVDGAEAIAAVANQRPDLILMDMSLPVMDGWEATKILKADPNTASIPIIALTAHAMAGEREKALSVGCDDYDTKPVELRRLLTKLQVFLGPAPTTKRRTVSTPISSSPKAASSQRRSTPVLDSEKATPPPSFAASSTPRVTSAGAAGSNVHSSVPSGPGDRRSTNIATGTLLVVDDNEDNRTMLSRRLGRKGHNVLTAVGGEAALTILNQTTVDVVLLDVMMPGIDGLETLQRIRQHYTQVELPVIMVTAKDDSQDMLRAFELGANDYVTKPIDFEVTIARIQTQLLTAQAVRRQSSATASPKRSVPSTYRPSRSPSPSPESTHSPNTGRSSSPSPLSSVRGTPSSLTSGSGSAFAAPPPSFRPPSPLPTAGRDRLTERYEIVKILVDTPLSQLLIAQDVQQPSQPYYLINKINLAAFPLDRDNVPPIDQLRELLQSEILQIQTISQHEYITSLVHTFEHDGAFFLVQEYVDGTLLSDDLRLKAPVPFTQVIPLFKELFSTLEFIHQQQIVHGAIHADHLIRRHVDDRLMLIDFGLTQRILARLMTDTSSQTEYIQGYMPPEQCQGNLLRSSDVYALGMLMLHALTGKSAEYIDRDAVSGELKWQEWLDLDDKTAQVIDKMVRQNHLQRYAYPEQASKDLLFQWYSVRFKRKLS